jgi:hypothetical protein
VGTIKPGFWTTNFIIAPDEFEGFVRFCIKNGLMFHEHLLGGPERDADVVCAGWKRGYDWLASGVKPEQLRASSISYSLMFQTAKRTAGFTLLPNEILFQYRDKWAEARIPYLSLSCCKGYSVDKTDERGDYFVYEDIMLHEPELYPKYELVSLYVKGITKPLRFKTWIGSDFREYKPSVRVSEKAAAGIAGGWIFREYQLEMRSFARKGKC